MNLGVALRCLCFGFLLFSVMFNHKCRVIGIYCKIYNVTISCSCLLIYFISLCKCVRCRYVKVHIKFSNYRKKIVFTYLHFAVVLLAPPEAGRSHGPAAGWGCSLPSSVAQCEVACSHQDSVPQKCPFLPRVAKPCLRQSPKAQHGYIKI